MKISYPFVYHTGFPCQTVPFSDPVCGQKHSAGSGHIQARQDCIKKIEPVFSDPQPGQARIAYSTEYTIRACMIALLLQGHYSPFRRPNVPLDTDACCILVSPLCLCSRNGFMAHRVPAFHIIRSGLVRSLFRFCCHQLRQNCPASGGHIFSICSTFKINTVAPPTGTSSEML